MFPLAGSKAWHRYIWLDIKRPRNKQSIWLGNLKGRYRFHAWRQDSPWRVVAHCYGLRA